MPIRSKWQFLVAPAAPSLYPPEFTAMLPDLLTQVTFMQFNLQEALLRSWLKLPRTRDHTNLYIFSKDGDGSTRCSLWIYAPNQVRPWGVELPATCCICSCALLYSKPSNWVLKYHHSKRIGG